ncbi:dual oxidase maturation factor 1-like isoform X2 [Coturnix japonica]|uniref:dual oxidase maturation factor 1-like isoform X2 n=1 Tax=Coturnix japonica TaxID=93934 RepID=UPI0013A5C25A|nr:dual oxidase maturation factor 1-like isoform X2 [Coturnix japonica]
MSFQCTLSLRCLATRTKLSLIFTAMQFTRDWESGWVTANTSYKSFSHVMVNADIGLHIGLAGVNITLVGNPVNQVNETINYNEHFAWSFDADYDHSYSEGLEKGLPSPILYVAEKFTTHSPCNVHRQYRISSCYASIMLWMALCTWLISILLFSMPVLLYGGYMLLLTAVLMLFSLLFFITVRNIPKCPIQFGPASLKTDYGKSFWLTFTTGLLCLLLGLGVIVLNSVHPQKLKLVFNLDKGMREEVDGWDKSHLPAESSSSEQDVLMVSLDELCEVTATKL